MLVAALQATRTTGVAPLAVLFDATTTTAPRGVDPFRQLRYEFDFGDERGQTWPVSMQAKNTQSGGPLGAHVFEHAGIYTVRLRVTDPRTGTSDEATVLVTVLDADAHYGGGATVCVSSTADFSGCPAGALQQAGLPTAYGGLRVLLRRGETFPNVVLGVGDAGATVGAFGAGASPVVSAVYVGFDQPLNSDFATDIRVMDLQVTGSMIQCIGSRVLFLRNRVLGGGGGIYFGGVDYLANPSAAGRVLPVEDFQHAREIFLVENTVLGATGGEGYNAFGDGSRIALLGNTMGISQHHTLRLTAAHKALIAHNELRGVSLVGNGHALKLHSGGLLPYDDAYAVSGKSWASEQIVVADNVFGSVADNNQWTVDISPQSDAFNEGVQDVIIERNQFVRGTSSVEDLVLGGRRLTTRANTIAGGGSLLQGLGHTGSLSAEWNGPYYAD